VIKQCVRKILVFFRFEEELYKTYGVDVEFVGHPLLDNVKVTSSKENTKKRYGLSDENLTVAILPGSRQMEVTTLLPVMLSACKIIKWALGKVQFIVSRYEGLSKELYDEIINESRLDAKVASGDTYNVLAASDFAIVASGTATLETAMIATPFVIVYKTNLLTYLAAQIVMRNKFLGLVNIIADKEVVPEFLQFRAAPAKIAMESINIISDVDRKAAMVDAFRSVTSSLGEPGASMRAAASILPLLQ
jgi:lipid-A-disaccharide synthase